MSVWHKILPSALCNCCSLLGDVVDTNPGLVFLGSELPNLKWTRLLLGGDLLCEVSCSCHSILEGLLSTREDRPVLLGVDGCDRSTSVLLSMHGEDFVIITGLGLLHEKSIRIGPLHELLSVLGLYGS